MLDFAATGKHFSENVFTNSKNRDTIASEGDTVALENQRYGRNKDTLVNKTYIDSGDYRRKFDKITDDSAVNRVVYNKAKEMLKHRSGTLFEDMYWIDGVSGDIIASALNEKLEKGIIASPIRDKKILNNDNVLAIHTHPNSFPPSASDFNAFVRGNYKSAYIICHDGKVFGYYAGQEIDDSLYKAYIAKYLKEGYSEYES